MEDRAAEVVAKKVSVAQIVIEFGVIHPGVEKLGVGVDGLLIIPLSLLGVCRVESFLKGLIGLVEAGLQCLRSAICRLANGGHTAHQDEECEDHYAHISTLRPLPEWGCFQPLY